MPVLTMPVLQNEYEMISTIPTPAISTSDRLFTEVANAGAKQVFAAPSQWQPQLWQLPVFSGLARFFQLASCSDFPDLNQQSQWLAQSRDPTIRRAVSVDTLTADGRYYEAFIAATGQIPTRQRNWHDLFGNLIWALLPRSKAAMNEAHCLDIARDGLKQRSRRRHRLTQLDECGVLLLYPATQPDATILIEQLQQHQWLTAMWQQRQCWKDFWQVEPPSTGTHDSAEDHTAPWCSAFIVGHANLEMLTAPFRGLTGKMWPLAVPADFLQWPLLQRLDFIDTAFSQQIANVDMFMAQCMSPLPLLGVPGWAERQTESLYLDTGYFRPKPAPR
jgi:hypothetical protein